jgi:hypothetical protein
MLWAAAIVESQRHLAFLIRYVIRNRQDFSHRLRDEKSLVYCRGFALLA